MSSALRIGAKRVAAAAARPAQAAPRRAMSDGQARVLEQQKVFQANPHLHGESSLSPPSRTSTNLCRTCARESMLVYAFRERSGASRRQGFLCPASVSFCPSLIANVLAKSASQQHIYLCAVNYIHMLVPSSVRRRGGRVLVCCKSDVRLLNCKQQSPPACQYPQVLDAPLFRVRQDKKKSFSLPLSINSTYLSRSECHPLQSRPAAAEQQEGGRQRPHYLVGAPAVSPNYIIRVSFPDAVKNEHQTLDDVEMSPLNLAPTGSETEVKLDRSTSHESSFRR